MSLILATTALIPIILLAGWRGKVSMSSSTGGRKGTGPDPSDATATDPHLLQKHSTFHTITTSNFVYKGIRIFFRAHEQIDKLPCDPAPLPLLVFIHGLGGSAAQFHPLLISLVHVSSCLAIDLPGCGRSSRYRGPDDWNAVSPASLISFLETVIELHRDSARGQKVVLVAHSMGTALAAKLANKTLLPVSQRSPLSRHVVGLVAICPTAGPPKNRKALKKFVYVPESVFNMWRAWDARGGEESASVARFIGAGAEHETKVLQRRFNMQSRTPVWRRMAWGALDGPLPGDEVWKGLDVPVFLVGGSKDMATPPENVHIIEEWIRTKPVGAGDGETATPPCWRTIETTTASPKPARIEDICESSFLQPLRSESRQDDHSDDNPITPCETGGGEDDAAAFLIPAQPANPPKVVVKNIFDDGTHALLYTPPLARVLACLVSGFLDSHVTARFRQSWQLRYLSREGKWDVKNLEKWQKVAAVSAPVGERDIESSSGSSRRPGIFRAMKTLREVDPEHTPVAFARRYAGIISDVVDMSHQTPVYDPKGLEDGGVGYHKLATVSKIPPTDGEVEGFVKLVDGLRERHRGENGEYQERAIGVHCHYGFNRTGYFIVCYLVERCGFAVADAIENFAKARPKGIKHQHFLDKLFARYSFIRGRDE